MLGNIRICRNPNRLSSGRAGGYAPRVMGTRGLGALMGLVAVVSIATSGCGSSGAKVRPSDCGVIGKASTAHEPDRKLVLSPATVRPGQRFRIRIPRGQDAGFFMSELHPTHGCPNEYFLSADDAGPHWVAVPRSGKFAVTSEVMPDAGTVPAITPPSAAQGEYSICTQQSDRCASLTVRP